MAKSTEAEFGRPEPQRLCSDEQFLQITMENGFALADYVSMLFEEWCGELQLTPTVIQTANSIAMRGIYASAGQYRDQPVTVGGFVPPSWPRIPGLIAELCEYVNSSTDAIHSAGYLLWRLNWIHPFLDGNGRVARELAYLVLLVQYNSSEYAKLPSISHLIRLHQSRYFDALSDADRNWIAVQEPRIDRMESFIADLMVEQADPAP